MTRVIVICEGQTEETFINEVLYESLAYQQIYLVPLMINTSTNAKGGGLNYDRVKLFVQNTLKQEKQAWVTTFFDLYGLDKRFPNFEQSKSIVNVFEKTALLEQSFKDNICSYYSDASRRFFPYIRPYEFEGLLFSEISKLTDLNFEWQRIQPELQSIRDQFESPEHINDSFETRPSKRLADTLAPTGSSYKKTLHGPLTVKSIGLDKLCSECKHFASWYQKLVQLGTI